MSDLDVRRGAMGPKHSKESMLSPVHASRPSGWVGRPAQRPTPERPSIDVATQLRSLARRVHFLAGILVAPLLLVLCLTGLVYVFSPQIHDDLYGRQLYVGQVGETPRPVSEQVAAAMVAHPEAELRSVVPPAEPERTTRVNLSVPGWAEPGEMRSVYVDPYTNYINGELTTVDGRLPANVWLRDLHGDLHLGDVGRLYSETAASWLPVLAGGGLVLWISKQGRRRRNARELLVPAPRGKGAQGRLRSVHGPLGLWLTVGLLAMSITGLSMSRFAGRLFDARAPTLAMATVDVPAGRGPIGLDQVLGVARVEGLGGELELRPPASPDRPFTVTERSPGLPLRKGTISVDPYTAETTERIGWGDYPFLAQLRVLGVEVHTGTLLGLANQILLALLAVGTIVLVVVGYRMWWTRSPYRGQLRPAPPPALRRLTWPVGVPVLLGTVALGWLMPAFGISLLAFVVVDLAINAVRHRRERVRRTITAGALLAMAAVFGAAVLAHPSAPAGRVYAAGTHQGQDPAAGGGAPASDGRVTEAVPDEGVPDEGVPDEGVPDEGVPAPASSGTVARPDDRAGAPAGAAGGVDAAAVPTTPGGAGASPTPSTGSAAVTTNGGPGGSGEPSADGGGSARAAGDPGGGPGGSGSPRGVGDALSDVVRPVTALLHGLLDGLTGGHSGG